jgi:hypothetical protein
MRRTLAITLAAAVLLTGGCARQRPAADRPAPTTPAATSTNPAATSANSAATSTKSAATVRGETPATAEADPAGVDGLLDAIDKQLAGDSQPSEDQD